MNIRPSILIEKDNKILTLKYKYGNEDVYNLPGGNVEFGEGIKATLIREMEEELNLDVVVGEMVCSGEIHFPEKQTLHCIFEGTIIDGVPIINPKETKAIEVVWMPIAELTSINLYPSVSKHLQNWLYDDKPPLFLGIIDQKWID